jgi:hypothetical protein
MKGELERLQLAIERLKGKELEGMSFPDLISLENQLNESLHSVKDQKTQILLNQIERSRIQVRTELLKCQNHCYYQFVYNVESQHSCFVSLSLIGEKSIGRKPNLAQTGKDSSKPLY